MARGKKTGGRKKGSRNKRTLELQESGLQPKEFLLNIMRDEGRDLIVRMDAAKVVAPYVHSRLAAIEHTGKGGGPIETKSADPKDVARAVLALFREIQTD